MRAILWIGHQRVDSPEQLLERLKVKDGDEKKRLFMATEMLEKEEQLRSWLAGEVSDPDNPFFELTRADRRPTEEILAEICNVPADKLISAVHQAETGKSKTNRTGQYAGLTNVPPDMQAGTSEELESILRKKRSDRNADYMATIYLTGDVYLLDHPELLRNVRLQRSEKSRPRPKIYFHPGLRGQEISLKNSQVYLAGLELHCQGFHLADDSEYLLECT